MVKFPSLSFGKKKKNKADEEGKEGGGVEGNDAKEKSSDNPESSGEGALTGSKTNVKGNKKKGEKTDEEKAADAMDITGTDGQKGGYCKKCCSSAFCRCGRKTKEERERIKVLREKKDIEENERRDRQKELDDMASEEKLSWDALELPGKSMSNYTLIRTDPFIHLQILNLLTLCLPHPHLPTLPLTQIRHSNQNETASG